MGGIYYLLLAAALLLSANLYGQGVIPLTPEEYASLPQVVLPDSAVASQQRPKLLVLPSPPPGHQGSLGSCTAWATAYAAMDVLYSTPRAISLSPSRCYRGWRIAYPLIFCAYGWRDTGDEAAAPQGREGGSSLAYYRGAAAAVGIGVWRVETCTRGERRADASCLLVDAR